jgi:hypothetical protein
MHQLIPNVTVVAQPEAQARAEVVVRQGVGDSALGVQQSGELGKLHGEGKKPL